MIYHFYIKQKITSKLFAIVILFISAITKAQAPSNITLTTPQTVPTDETKRAQNSINLKAGFKYGANTNGSRLTLQISNYPSYVETGYSNPPSSCGVNPQSNNPLVGEIDGSFAVSPLGSATYQIPIKMSAGTAGMQPNLSLVYSSGSGSSIIGLGWSLSGLSAITRGNKNPYLDGKYEAVSMSLNDVFNIDGNRLLLKTGTYGTSGSSYDTEIASFADITANGSQGFGPQSFTVKDKNGTVTEYGSANDAHIVGVSDNTPLAWLVSKVTDEFGNYMVFHYTQLNGETVVNSIEYTGNANVGLNPYNEIIFEYQPKTEKNTFYVGGKEFHSTQLLKSITAKANGDLVKKYTFDYTFSFNTLLSAVHEINQDGTEVNPTEFCWSDPSSGSVSQNSATHNTDIYSNASDYNTLRLLIPSDLNGDGFSDFVALNGASYQVLINNYGANFGNNNNIGFNNSYSIISPINSSYSYSNSKTLSTNVFDSDLDGKQEVYIMESMNDFIDGGTQEQHNKTYDIYKISNNPTYQSSVVYSKTLLETTFLPMDYSTPSKFYYDKNDYSGDGVIDELIIDPETVQLNCSSGNSSINLANFSSDYFNDGLHQNIAKSIARPLDFDGDKVSEIIVFSDQTTSLIITIYKYISGAFSPIYNTSINYPSDNTSDLLKLLSIGDYNGDGKTDVAYLDNTKQNLKIVFSTGISFTSPKGIPSFDGLNTLSDYNISSPDINGDGISDIIFTESSSGTSQSYVAYYSIGDLFIKGATASGHFNYASYDVLKFYPKYGTYQAITESINIPINYQYSADFNGDGVYDIVSLDPAQTTIIINNLKETKKQFVSRVTSALNKQTNISYANTSTFFDVTKTLIYSNENIAISNPLVSINPNRFVVNRVGIDNTNVINISSRYRYVYGGALFHTTGKGFLGFSDFIQIDTQTGIGSVTSFTSNMTYFVAEITKKTGARFSAQTVSGITYWGYDPTQHTQISAQETNYNITPILGKQIFVAPSSSTQKNYLSSTASTSNFVYDINQKGYVTNSTTTYGWQGQPIIKTEQTNYTYQNINGIFKPQTVTSTSTQNGEPSYSRTKEFAYDVAGHLTSTTNDPTFGSQSLVTTYQNFNAFGSPTKATITAGDILPRTSQTIYDATGRFIVKTINPKGDVEEFVYEPKYGTLTQKKDISGLISKYYYDGLGRLIKTQLPDNTTNTTEYNWTPQPSSTSTYYKTVKNEGEAYSTTFYNHLGQVASTETIDFNGNIIVMDNKYNYLTGILEESSEPHFTSQTTTYLVTKYTYDDFLRPLKTELFKKTGTNSYTSKNIFSNYTYNTTSMDLWWGTQYSNSFTQVTDQTNKTIIKKNNAAGQETVTENTQTTGSGMFTVSNTQTSSYEYHSNGNPKKNTLTYSDLPDVITHNFSYNNLGQQTQLIDPSAGTVNYLYNTLGELLHQDDANGIFNYTYDNIGRVLTRTAPIISGNTTFQYVTANAGKNKLEKIIGQNVTTEFTYDNLSRPITFKETVNSTGKVFTNATQYDTYSRVSQQTHTGGFVTKYSYAPTGELITIKNASNQLLWQRNDQNALGQITDYTYGNGINTTKVYNDLHQLNEINHGSIHQQLYNFDPLTSNLLQRDFINNTTGTHNREKFAFDALDRLNQTKQTDPANMDAQLYTNNTAIDSKGNITHKDDAGDFLYGNTTQPFNITQINNPSPLIPIIPLSNTINDLRKVNQIAEGNKEMNFMYGNDDERIKVDYLVGGIKQYTRYYQANYDYQEDALATNTKEWTYLYAPTGLLAVYYKQNTTGELLYALTDHLGSPVMLTNQAQNIVEEYSFDAWGRRRNPVDWTYTATTPSILNRGFTIHEHIDEFGLINMNGRVYDPVLGRFIQADNYVQSPDNLQNFNRYAYVYNNPLKYSDPDGQWINFVVGAFIGGITGWQIGEANGATGWGMAGYIVGGAIIGAATAGIGSAVTAGLGAVIPVAYGGGLSATIIGGVAAGVVSNIGFTALSGNNLSGQSILYSAATGAIGATFGAGIGGDFGNFTGGALSGWMGSASNSDNAIDALMQASLSGILSVASYNLEERVTYASTNKSLTFEQFRTISRGAQKSFVEGREYGGWIFEDGSASVTKGTEHGVKLSLNKPEGAKATWHTHPNVGKGEGVVFTTQHSPDDRFMTGRYWKVPSIVISRKASWEYRPFQYQINKTESLPYQNYFIKYPFNYYGF